MKVVILAGGLGTRISEESDFKPKPLITIGTMPILWHIMKIYSHFNFNEFIICCGYKGNLIKDFFTTTLSQIQILKLIQKKTQLTSLNQMLKVGKLS